MYCVKSKGLMHKKECSWSPVCSVHLQVGLWRARAMAFEPAHQAEACCCSLLHATRSFSSTGTPGGSSPAKGYVSSIYWTALQSDLCPCRTTPCTHRQTDINPKGPVGLPSTSVWWPTKEVHAFKGKASGSSLKNFQYWPATNKSVTHGFEGVVYSTSVLSTLKVWWKRNWRRGDTTDTYHSPFLTYRFRLPLLFSCLDTLDNGKQRKAQNYMFLFSNFIPAVKKMLIQYLL